MKQILKNVWSLSSASQRDAHSFKSTFPLKKISRDAYKTPTAFHFSAPQGKGKETTVSMSKVNGKI